MAGAPVGLMMARPSIVKKIGLYDHDWRPSIRTTACATASFTQTGLINARRKEMWETRARITPC
jgi:histidinol-phosphate/aromatic aminotransferase/cobyric acid decarboxylase-like protein